MNKLVLDIDKEYNHGGKKVIFDATMDAIANYRLSAQIDYRGAKDRIDSIVANPDLSTMERRKPDPKNWQTWETFEKGQKRRERLIRNWEELNRLMPLVDKIFDDLINAVKAHRQACGQLED